MALEGALSDFGLADILQLIFFQKKTGTLELAGRIDTVKLRFVDGNIIGAESRKRAEDKRIGKILLKKGLILESNLNIALEEHRKTGIKLGNILAKSGLVDKDALMEIITAQITETVIQLFGWKQGTYEFNAQGVPGDKEFGVSLDTQHLLMEGLRIVDEWSQVKERILIDSVFRKQPEAPVDLTTDEAEIFSYVDGENDVSTIIDLSEKDSFEVSKTLISLIDKGAISALETAPILSEDAMVKMRRPAAFIYYLFPGALALSLALSLFSLSFSSSNALQELRVVKKIEELRLKIEAYRFEHAEYPQSLELISQEKDPWGRPYLYRITGNTFYLASTGPDGKEDTADDIY